MCVWYVYIGTESINCMKTGHNLNWISNFEFMSSGGYGVEAMRTILSMIMYLPGRWTVQFNNKTKNV